MKEYIVDTDDFDSHDALVGYIKYNYKELIRCKDCIWRYQSQNNDLHYCFETNIEVSDDDFCSRAKRRIE